MKYTIILFLIFGLVSICYADRVCLEKSTGKLVEYQSGDAPLGILVKNAINAGYKKEDVEEKYITKEEWKIIREEQIDKPARDKAKEKELERKQKEQAIKQKLNLSEQDWQDLKEALKE